MIHAERLRPLNAAGLERKYDMDAYLRNVARIDLGTGSA